ncbi:phosphatidylglycerophosphatase A [Bathymodiolus japonicus methanotrophic gill symbiont]|uniref:phosphatidylglycerophosphatase A family protein n=1 Tax=Bathymodiolus japonicus methanotrophic gill symbiont TaxID=113269 RepID=UPI001B524F52|nr:phosphatidylglycerophosphatase A [Bathymodiolus japonicus methanotrophic gill symbiont]GFO72370.1 phosphatidylglycerophosphatase A [Bathymodiolus japonicus methanotrophic gill symbiont]
MFLTRVGKNQLTAREILIDPVLCLAFGFGSGLARKAPGTFGTLAAVPIYLVLVQANNWVYSIVAVLSSIIGIWICGIAADKLGEHDFGGIVWDEIAGFLITMWFVVFSWQNLIAGFVLFRIFDIFKPWPIRWIDQKISGGFGIMLDDVIAGLMAGLVLVFLNL